MAQNNPVNESSSYATTGGANAPLNSSSSYGSTTHPNTHPTSTSSTQPSTGDKLKEAGSSVKGILAGVHGAGEKLRGDFNSGVDRTFNEPEGVVKNQQISDAGDSEISTGQFAPSTKNQEGFVPGDHEKRL